MNLKKRLDFRPHRYATAVVLLVVFWYFSNFGGPYNGSSDAIEEAHNSETYQPFQNIDVDKRATIGKITMLYGDAHEGMYGRVLQGHERHAVMHGYESIVLHEKLLHGLWSKVGFLLSTIMKELEKPMDERLQWLFWFDCDIVLLNAQIPLDIFLPPDDFRHLNLIVTNDHNGLNSGAFFIRVNEWSVQFFINIMSLPDYRPDVKLKYSDQSAMEYVLQQDRYRKQTIFVPQRWFNAYRGPRDAKEELIKGKKVPENTIKRGDLQLHFAGKETTGIKTYIPFWLNVSEQRDWETPLRQTTYEKEVGDFWNTQRRSVGS